MITRVEQDIRDIRKEVQDIAKDGCGHRTPHEHAIDILHQRADGERSERIEADNKLWKRIDRIYYTSLVTAGGIITLLIKSFFPLLVGK